MSDTSLRRAKRLARALDASELHQMHDVLIIYNGMVVTLTAAFMSLTQDKIIRSFHARAFLEQLSSVPLPPVIFALTTNCSVCPLYWLSIS